MTNTENTTPSRLFSNPSKYALGFFCAILGATLWGMCGIFAQILVNEPYSMTPAFITAVRAPIAAAPLLVLALTRDRTTFFKMLKDRKAILLILATGFIMYITQYSFSEASYFINAPTATMLQAPSCVLVMFVVCVQLGIRPKKLHALAVALAIMGTWLIVTDGDMTQIELNGPGLIWGLIDCLANAMYVLVPRSIYKTWGIKSTIALTATANALVSTVVLVGQSLIFGGTGISAVGGSSALAPALTFSGLAILIGGSAILGTAVPHGAYLYGTSIVGAVTASLLAAVEPVAANIFGIILVDTKLSWADWLGTAFLVLMIVLVALASKESPEESRAVEATFEPEP